MKKKLIITLAIILMALPLSLIAIITYLEMEEYKPQVAHTIGQGAYGELKGVIRGDIEEALSLKGTITSREHAFIDVSNKGFGLVKTLVNVGDEVKKGEVLLYINDKALASSVDGIVEEINVGGDKGYVKLLNLSSLTFVSYSKEMEKLEVGKEYSLEEGGTATLTYLSNAWEEQGRKGYFTLSGDGFIYGESKELRIKTGVGHSGVLMVDKDCVYQKEKEGPYYLRRMESSGKPLGEIEVKVGMDNGEYITITGAEEGWYCDSGYGKFMKSNTGGEQ